MTRYNLRRVRRTGRLVLGVSVLAAIAATIDASATVRYVDASGTSATPPYTNWAIAAVTIQQAVDAAAPGDEILVTNGTYATGGRAAGTNVLVNRVTVDKPLTLRSVNGPTVTVIEGYQVPGTTNGDSAVRCVYLANGATLIGFTLTNGATRWEAGTQDKQSGGGVWCESASAVVSNCTLAGNSAAYGGGAYGGTLNDCTLTGNSAAGHGGGALGGTLNDCTLTGNSAAIIGGGGASGCTLNNCTLTGNSAVDYRYSGVGGGAYFCTLNNCTLTGNSAKGGGGASGGTLNNCTLTGNSALAGSGGGAFGGTLNNCTLTGNSASDSGGGAYPTSVFLGTLNNCIVYFNTAPTYANYDGSSYGSTLSYCCTTPLPSSGTGNFTNAPLFVDYAGGNLRLQPGSPCINAGNNAYAVGPTDLAGQPRIAGGTVDVGAYEFQGPYLNAAATAGGSVTRDPDLPYYPPGSRVTVTATAAPSYGFIRWTGDASGSTNPLTVILDTTENITAVFASTALTLASQGVGTFTKVPDQPFYAVGQPVTATATAGRWYVFSRWLDGVTNNPRVITIGESNRYTAVFTPTTPLETVTLGGVSRLAPVGMPAVLVDGVFILTPSASARGSALVTLSTTFPGGTLLYTLDGSEPTFASPLYTGPFTVREADVLRTLAYNADFSQSVAGDPLAIVLLPTLTALTAGGGSVAIAPPSGAYFSNGLATVTATAAPGWTFLHWLGDATGTNPIVSLSMTRNKVVRAVFGTTLNTTVAGGGSLVVSPVSPWYSYGSQVRLIPVPAAGNYFAFWANAASGKTDDPLIFTLTGANPTVTAVFASLGGTGTDALTVILNGRGQVTLTPPGNRFPLNTNVTLHATPDAGQQFLGWSGDASGSQNPLVVTMNSNQVITANFTKRPWLQGEGNPGRLGQEGFRLTLTGEFGVAYQIFGSSDLRAWTLLGTVTNDWGTVQFTGSGAATNAQRFYRARPVK